jgi:hypothetical protein
MMANQKKSPLIPEINLEKMDQEKSKTKTNILFPKKS